MEHRLTGILDRRMVWAVALFFCLLTLFPPQTQAALVESQTSDGQTISQRVESLDTVRKMLEQDVVSQRLADYGYTKEEVLAKVQNASDEQLHQLASLSDSLAAGADGLSLVVTILVIVLLIVLILKISDKQIIIR
ncbi:MAG: PA2779 family protein [Desulfuromonadales bacterium]|nr:PA2779 family protein [Desulfuromonadales bacterium]